MPHRAAGHHLRNAPSRWRPHSVRPFRGGMIKAADLGSRPKADMSALPRKKEAAGNGKPVEIL